MYVFSVGAFLEGFFSRGVPTPLEKTVLSGGCPMWRQCAEAGVYRHGLAGSDVAAMRRGRGEASWFGRSVEGSSRAIHRGKDGRPAAGPPRYIYVSFVRIGQKGGPAAAIARLVVLGRNVVARRLKRTMRTSAICCRGQSDASRRQTRRPRRRANDPAPGRQTNDGR